MGPSKTSNKKAASIAATIVAIASIEKKKKKRIWSRRWLQRRAQLGCYENLMRELALEDIEGYRRFLRMTTANFELLLQKVSSGIRKTNTRLRESISSGERLAVTLRYLATGETQSSLAYHFRIAQNTISGIIPEVCSEIYRALSEEYLTVPSNKEEWEEVSCNFFHFWNFPNCIGAMDGKHIKITPPPNSGSLYYNYKGDYSIVLLALVDANLRFLYIDVGTNGRISDGGVWAKSSLKAALDANVLNIPQNCILPGTRTRLPYVIVADDAFPLTINIMKPFPGKNLSNEKIIFNYRLSRARRVSENAFGILAARFQVFKSRILASPMKVQKIVKATCCLHNYLSNHSPTYMQESSIDVEDIPNESVRLGDWRKEPNGLIPLRKSVCKATHYGKEVQKSFCSYFNSVGSVSWQNTMAKLH